MRRSLTRATAVTTAAALALSLLTSSTALAEENDPVLTEEARAEQAALEQAAETGESVPVEELLGERRDVVANPDGTFTATEYVQPVRTRQDDMWVDTDPTLLEREDGRLAPRASTLGLSLSNGGEGPLAVLTRAGKELELGWPTSLPEPTVDGETATYPQVLPGVDLVLRASVDGLSQVLVVEDAEAAAQPEIAQLRMSVSMDGLQMATTDHGGIEAVDTSVGGAVFEAPTPLMWDSGSSGDDELSTMSADAADTELDPVEGPLESSTIAQIGVEASDDALVLTPNEQLLQDSATNYPVYIDPVWKTSTTSAWAMVSSGYRTDSYWKFSGSDDEGVGRCPQLAGDPYYCSNVGIKRLFYRISTSAYADKQILSAEFAVTLRHTYDSTGRATRLYRTGGITSSTTWANQPSWTESLDTKSPTTPAGSCTRTNQNVRFDAKSAVEWAASGRRSTTTFGLRSVNEDSYSHWKRFCDNAQLEVNYNTVPNQPRQTDLQLEPGGACVYGNQRPYVDEPPRVSAYLRDPDHSTGATEQVRAQFRVFWTDEAGQEQERTFTTSYKAANSRFYYQVSDDIPEDAVLGWVVRANDGHAWGPWSWDGEQTRCEFVYDSTIPEEPTITSTQYPNDDQWHTGVGDSGQFRFETTSEDVESFRWGINEHPSAGNEISALTSVGSNGISYIGRLHWVPEMEGPYSLYVDAVDSAGNVSTRASYLFLVSSGRGEISRWPMEKSDSSGIIEDIIGGHDAALGSAVSITGDAPGEANFPSALLDGSDESYIDPPQGANSGFGGVHSFSGWVRLDDTTRDQVVVSRFGDEQGEGGIKLPREFRLYYSADENEWVVDYTFFAKEFCVRCPNPGEPSYVERSFSVFGGSAAPGRWAHIAYVANFDSLGNVYIPNGFNGARLYVNGVVVDEEEVERNPRSPVPRPRGDVQFGREFARTDSGRDYGSHFEGAFHDFRLFDRVLAPGEVDRLIDLPVARDAYWDFTDVVDGVSPEASGEQPMALHDGAGIFTGDPFLEPALVGEGHLELGGGGYADTGEAVVATDGSFTLSLRARLASAQPEQSMSVLSQAGQTQSPFDVRYSAEADRWELLLARGDDAESDTTSVVNDLFVPSSEQSGDHLAVVYDAFSREVRFYVNGQLSQTSTVQHSSPWVSTGPLSIGRALHDGAWGSSFSGAVDDVRVYRGAADATLISRLASLTEQPDL